MGSNYYENLNCATAKNRLATLDHGLYELGKALNELPDVPSINVLLLLSKPAMQVKGMALWEMGKELQLKYGLDLIPPNAELETGAGFWEIIKNGLPISD